MYSSSTWRRPHGPQYRFPRYFSLDLRVSKDIQVNAKHAVRLSGSVRNLTDHFNPLEVHSNTADPSMALFWEHRPASRARLRFSFLIVAALPLGDASRTRSLEIRRAHGCACLKKGTVRQEHLSLVFRIQLNSAS
jgi:hypothetical protein